MRASEALHRKRVQMQLGPECEGEPLTRWPRSSVTLRPHPQRLLQGCREIQDISAMLGSPEKSGAVWIINRCAGAWLIVWAASWRWGSAP